MWSWAGHIKPGTTSDAVVGHIDLYPTLLDMLGLPKSSEQKLDGVSYARVLKSEGSLDRQAFFNYFPHGRSPARVGAYGSAQVIGNCSGGLVCPVVTRRIRAVQSPRRPERNEESRCRATRTRKATGRLITAFLNDTGATYPRPNPNYKPGAPKAGKAKGRLQTLAPTRSRLGSLASAKLRCRTACLR